MFEKHNLSHGCSVAPKSQQRVTLPSVSIPECSGSSDAQPTVCLQRLETLGLPTVWALTDLGAFVVLHSVKIKGEICDHQSHTENSPYSPLGKQFGLAACALCYSPVCGSSTPFSGHPPKPHPSQRKRNMETVADHNFFCFIFKPPGQVFNFITVPLPTTVWWRTRFFSSI